jgi:hypothetical protein
VSLLSLNHFSLHCRLHNLDTPFSTSLPGGPENYPGNSDISRSFKVLKYISKTKLELFRIEWHQNFANFALDHFELHSQQDSVSEFFGHASRQSLYHDPEPNHHDVLQCLVAMTTAPLFAMTTAPGWSAPVDLE